MGLTTRSNRTTAKCISGLISFLILTVSVISSISATTQKSLDHSPFTNSRRSQFLQRWLTKKKGYQVLLPIATRDGENSWSAEFNIGTPSQKVFLQVDTGSGSTTVLQSFEKSLSSTLKPLGVTEETLRYGSGFEVTGKTFTDIFAFGKYVVSGLPFLVGDKIKGEVAANGILGLGFGADIANFENSKSIFDILLEQKRIQTPVFSVQLIPKGGGEILFGGIDFSKVAGKITYEYLASPTEWLIPVEFFIGEGGVGVIENNSTIKVNEPVFGEALIDTGATLAYFDDDLAFTIYKLIPGSSKGKSDKLWRLPCDSTQLPELKFVINKVAFEIPKRDLIFEQTKDDPTQCVGGIQGGTSFDKWVIGDNFIKNYYVIYDRGPKPRIGISRRWDIQYV